jgi:hypothetical protein
MCPFDPNPPFPASDSESGSGGRDADSPLVLRASIGPYDYAVLDAASEQPMLDWLADNGFFVPAGTDAAVDPYIRAGAYFLALKLRSGQSSGDLQPVVLRYPSALPMVPIVLTSVAADPNMPILVWVLGDSRAIPRNYFHTRLNDAALDWLNAGANYLEVVKRAVDDAERGQSFVTEYAGSSEPMIGVLDYEGRFGDLDDLSRIADAVYFVQYLYTWGFAVATNAPPFFAPQFSSQILTILGRELPVPPRLLKYGVTPDEYYGYMAYYIGSFRAEHPDLFEGKQMRPRNRGSEAESRT